MATRKVTVTIDSDRLDAVRELVNAGQARSTSAFVDHAVAMALDDVAGWSRELGLALDETGGPLTDEERAWADDVLRGVA